LLVYLSVQVELVLELLLELVVPEFHKYHAAALPKSLLAFTVVYLPLAYTLYEPSEFLENQKLVQLIFLVIVG
jgi:hypothetical protein